MSTIRRELALLICETIRQENRIKWYTLSKLRCWGCMRFSKGDLSKMCMSRQEGYRGCNLVNERYAKLSNKMSKTSIT